MDYDNNWAIVFDYEVKEVLHGEKSEIEAIAEKDYGDSAIVVKVFDPNIPVQVGDRYDGSYFWRKVVAMEN